MSLSQILLKRKHSIRFIVIAMCKQKHQLSQENQTSMWMIRKSSRSSNCNIQHPKRQKQAKHFQKRGPYIHDTMWKQRKQNRVTHLRIHPKQGKDQSISTQTWNNTQINPFRQNISNSHPFHWHQKQKQMCSLFFFFFFFFSHLPILLLTMAPMPSPWGLAKNFLTTERGSFTTTSAFSFSGILLFFFFKFSLSQWISKQIYATNGSVFFAANVRNRTRKFRVYIGRKEREREIRVC